MRKLLDLIWPKNWLLVRASALGAPSICSSHRTRAAAVLAIPVDAVAYSVITRAQYRNWSALAAYWAITPTEETR